MTLSGAVGNVGDKNRVGGEDRYGRACKGEDTGLLAKGIQSFEYVSEARDKRRNDLDPFVLALVSDEISTSYELKTAASLSPGATTPALARLGKARFILQGRPGPRGRTDHKITAEGRRHLKRGWRNLIDDGPSGDPDADLRVALLFLWVGVDCWLPIFCCSRQRADSSPSRQ